MQEFLSDPVVEPDPARDFLHVGADLLGEIGDLVDEGYLGGKEGVGGIFCQLGRASIRIEYRRCVEVKRPIHLGHHAPSARVFGSDDDPVGMLEIADRRAFTQELGIRDDGNLGVRILFPDDTFDLVAGADRNRGFGYHHRLFLKHACDFARGRVDIGKVGMAVAAARRRAHRDEHHFRGADRRLQITRKRKAALPHVTRYQFSKPGLVYRHLPIVEAGNLLGVAVDTDHVMAKIGKARP